MQMHYIEWLRSITKDSFEYPITDEELLELLITIPIHEYSDNEIYEYNGNFIITKDEDIYEEHCDDMCCGTVTRTVRLSNKQTLYFAFDYGH